MDDNRTYLGNIYGIYEECITNISIDIYDITIDIHQYIHQTHRRRLRIMDIYGYSFYIPYYINFLAMFHKFALVCFLIYGVKSRSGHDRSQSFGPIWHVSGPEIIF